MKLQTSEMFQVYLRAADRIQQMIARSDPGDHVDAWVQALFAIGKTWDSMTEVPYRVVDPRMFAYEAGREVHRLFHAVQLLAEWRFTPDTDVTDSAVVQAFNDIANDSGSNGVIFPDGDVSPAAQREICNLPIIAEASGANWPIAEQFTNIVAGNSTFLLTGCGDVAVVPVPPRVRFDPVRQIWDVVRG